MPPQQEEPAAIDQDRAPMTDFIATETQDHDHGGKVLKALETSETVVGSEESDEDPMGKDNVATTAKTNIDGNASSSARPNRWDALRNRMRWQPRRGVKDSQVATPSGARSTNTPTDPQSTRPARISVTVVKEEPDSKWGFGIGNVDDRKNVKSVQIETLTGAGLLEGAPLQCGDLLQAVNQQPCQDAETAIQELVQHPSGQVTLEFVVPNGNHHMVQATVLRNHKPEDTLTTTDALGINFFNSQTERVNEEEADVSEEPEASSGATTPAPGDKTDKVPVEEPPAPPAPPAQQDLDMKNTPPQQQSLLQINQLTPTGLLSQSVLKQGDIVLSINDTQCSQMVAEEATALLDDSTAVTTIIVLRPDAEGPMTRAQRFMRQAKRAGIALGGGTMVGVGLIFIPTLPPPFGEVLIAGGVAVLGTEFEAPKRAMKSARDSLEKAVGREGETSTTTQDTSSGTSDENATNCDSSSETTVKEEETTDQDGGDPLPAADAEAANADGKGTNNKPTKRTMKDRFKNFSRRHVLPFLDQVVGDRKDGEGSFAAQGVNTNDETVPVGATSSVLPSTKDDETTVDEASPSAEETQETDSVSNDEEPAGNNGDSAAVDANDDPKVQEIESVSNDEEPAGNDDSSPAETGQTVDPEQEGSDNVKKNVQKS